jgi:hypothetical protein
MGHVRRKSGKFKARFALLIGMLGENMKYGHLGVDIKALLNES